MATALTRAEPRTAEDIQREVLDGLRSDPRVRGVRGNPSGPDSYRSRRTPWPK
jgi:hypothetical protein